MTTFSVELLPDYVNVHRDELLVQATLGSKTIDYVEVMPSVKWKDQLNYLDTDVDLRVASCEWAPGSQINFGVRYIETHPLESQLEICWLDMEKKFMNYKLSYDALKAENNLPFEEKIMDSIKASVQEKIENLIWLGNSGLGITGFLADAAEASAATVSFASGETAVSKIDAMVAALPIAMLKKEGGVKIFVSYSDARAYVQELNGSCCSNRAIVDSNQEVFDYLGDSRVKIVPVLGLEDAPNGEMVAATADALVYATDVEGAETNIDLWYSKDDKKFKFQLIFRMGTAVKYPTEVVVGSAE